MKQLKELYVELLGEIVDDDWKIFTNNNPNIKSLTSNYALSTESLVFLVSNLVHLEDLKISNSFDDSMLVSTDLRLFLENCKNFKNIEEKLKTIKFQYEAAGISIEGF